MAERTRTRSTVTASTENPDPKMKQSHKVNVGDNVSLNGTLFAIMSRQYAWEMVVPEGSESSLKNPTMASPSFMPDMPGDYIVSLPTDEGVAIITINAM